MRKSLIVIIILVMAAMLYMNNDKNMIHNFDHDKIIVKISKPLEFGNGYQYSVLVRNENEYLIKQLDLAIGFRTIEDETGTTVLWMDAKPNGQSIDIKPNSEMSYSLYLPFDLVKREEILFEVIKARYIGYYYSLEVQNRFESWRNVDVVY